MAGRAASTRGDVESTYLLAKGILKPWLKVWFRWTIEGLGNIPTQGPAIVAFNHISYLDPFAAAYVVDQAGRRPRFLAKSELFQDRRISWILRGAGQIEVKRGTPQAPMALDHAVDALRSGEVIVIFPEGTITDDPNLKPLPPKTGLSRLALMTGAPVLPAALWGTQNVWPKSYAKQLRPRQEIAVRVGQPLAVRGDADDPEGWDRIARQVMEAIALLTAGLRPAVPDRRRPKKRAA